MYDLLARSIISTYLSSIVDVSPSERRRLQRIAEKNANTTCFACREKGHAARDCPTNENGDAESKPVGMCYRCVSLSYSLRPCLNSEVRNT